MSARCSTESFRIAQLVRVYVPLLTQSLNLICFQGNYSNKQISRLFVTIFTPERKIIRSHSLGIFDLCCLHELAHVFEVWILQSLKEDSLLKRVTFFIT